MKGYVLINECTDPSVTRDRVLPLAAAQAAQQVELAPWWQRTPLEVLQADSEAAAPTEDGWTLVKVVDVLDDPQALAYHTTLASGRPAILVGAHIVRANAPAGSDWLAGPDSLSTAVSHELCETTVNPYCSFFSPYDQESWIPLEVCDPVQGDTYEQLPGSGVYVSNFVGPRYFSGSFGPYDRMELVTAPREVRPGGYQQRLTGGPGGTSAPVWGEKLAAWKRLAKTKAGTRFASIAAQATRSDAAASLRAELEQLRAELATARRAHGERLVGSGGHGG